MKNFRRFLEEEKKKKPETKISRLEKAVRKVESAAKKPKATAKPDAKKPEREPSKWEQRGSPAFPRDPSVRVMAFGRCNPFTSAHAGLYSRIEKEAVKQGGHPEFVVSRSHGDESNPLDPETKMKHIKRAMPGANFTLAHEDHPSLMHQVKRAYDEGVRHLTIVGGGDRKNYEELIKKYNGTPAGGYKFHSIKFINAGERNASGALGAVSGTSQRQHARNNDFESFRRGSANPKDWVGTREHFNDLQKAMKEVEKKKKDAPKKKKQSSGT